MNPEPNPHAADPSQPPGHQPSTEPTSDQGGSTSIPPPSSDAPTAPAPDQTPLSAAPSPPLPPIRRAPVDPWAHRRGEPRVFAFLWTVYVLLAVGGSVLWVSRFAAVTAGSFSPAARIMLVVVAVGATILWPMVRLSQASARRDVVGHALVDAVIVLTPVQLVLWPLIALANWPVSIVVAVAALLVAWIGLCGGILALGLSGPPARQPGDASIPHRTTWMLVILACVCAGPLVSFALRATHTAEPPWIPMLSPLTAIPHLTGVGISGPQNPATPLEYRLMGLAAGLGVLCWTAAFIRSSLGNRADPA